LKAGLAFYKNFKWIPAMPCKMQLSQMVTRVFWFISACIGFNHTQIQKHTYTHMDVGRKIHMGREDG